MALRKRCSPGSRTAPRIPSIAPSRRGANTIGTTTFASTVGATAARRRRPTRARRKTSKRKSARRRPDITFRAFADQYLRDYADQHKRSADRDRQILTVLNRTFGGTILHEIAAHRILQWQRDRLAGTWRAREQKRPAKAVRPGTVNRELDTLRALLAKAVQWKIAANPATEVRRIKVDNRRTRILTDDEQRRLLEAAPKKLRAVIALALTTAARSGEILALQWCQVTADELIFLHTKNGKVRRLRLSPSILAILETLLRTGRHVFTNARTGDAYTPNGVRHVFDRAVVRANVERLEEITPHTPQVTRR